MDVFRMCNIDANSLVFYDYYDYYRNTKSSLENSLNNLKNNDTKGKISNAARKKIIRAVNLMHSLSIVKKFYNHTTGRTSSVKTTLITLTLSAPQIHCDKLIKSKCLNRFLQIMREQKKMNSYLWRAEAQKNGNIHFHIQTNICISHIELRNIWNNCQEILGYITRFKEANGHDNPNSTDIHAIYKVKNLGAYVSKYLAKENGYRAIVGRQWFLSRNLSKIKPISLPYYGSLAIELENYISKYSDKILYLEKAIVSYAKFFETDLTKFPQLLQIRNDYLKINIPLIN